MGKARTSQSEMSERATFAHNCARPLQCPTAGGNFGMFQMSALRFPLEGLRFSGALLFASALSAATPAAPLPVDLPSGLELVVAAAPPVVSYPIMGCLDDRGRLFIGDAAGLNLDKKGLEAKLPNRVLMLEDRDRDGVFERSTVFADKMTFPQGACWLNGSLYVASPPGIWKLTDTNDDGVADQREMIVGGFEYTGNAADVHGPFLHPHGRLYWCHGRKGHKVVQKDGTVVHEGLASGVWSCKPDGSDVQWHALASSDNPVEVDFTPEGQIVGVVNLYYNQPRGDTILHWLYGGVYERPDQLKAIADLPRTQERMPVVHNLGHVAVSGFTRYRSGALNPEWRDQLFVTFFNTQKLVRVKLTPSGATYQATEHEFLKLNLPDAHFTDVIEDADGSLLVLDTGGWFRLGCPSSIAEKPDLRGAIYRVRKKGAAPVRDPYGLEIAWANLSPAELTKLRTSDPRWMVREKAMNLTGGEFPALDAAKLTRAQLLDRSQPFARLRAWEAVAHAKQLAAGQREALLEMLLENLEPTLEHAAMFAAIATRAFDLQALRQAAEPALIRRLMVVLEQSARDREPAVHDAVLGVALKHLESPDAALAQTSTLVVARHPRAIELCDQELKVKLADRAVSPAMIKVIAEVTGAQLAKPQAQALVTAMLDHPAAAVRQAAWRVIGGQTGAVSHADWLPRLEAALKTAAAGGGGDLTLVLDAIAKQPVKHFAAALQALSNDRNRPMPLRLRALGAATRPGEPLTAESFALLFDLAKGDGSPTARIDATRLLARARLTKEQQASLASLVAVAGAIELGELLRVARRLDAASTEKWATQIVQSPAFAGLEESTVRTAFQSLSPATYERVLGPAVRAVAADNDAKKRKLETLTAAAAKGRASEGRAVYAASACAACHTAGGVGRAMGPDLSRIGNIRGPRDLLESILFPNATLARDYETHVIETGDGQSHMGALKSEGADALVLIDLTGAEKAIPQAQIVGRTTLTTSLMPAGLEQAFTEQQLLDLVAWLASLK
jgi:putative membrane-bound dehydrogenase-like protein